MKRKYFIAGYNLDIDFDSDAVLEERLKEYRVESFDKADITIAVNKTIGEIEIANDDVVEMVSLGNNKLATRNEGFLFAFWSIVPFIISASFICGGLVGRFV